MWNFVEEALPLHVKIKWLSIHYWLQRMLLLSYDWHHDPDQRPQKVTTRAIYYTNNETVTDEHVKVPVQ